MFRSEPPFDSDGSLALTSLRDVDDALHEVVAEPGMDRDWPVSSRDGDVIDITHATGLLAAGRMHLFVKRAMDLVLASILLLIASPVMILIAVAVAVDTPGPILYVQERVGKDGRRFRMLKFRSMGADAHAVRDEFITLNEIDGPVFKLRDDPRVTRVGRAIRRASLDELPQLFNVLKGDMSLVGPRPALPEEVTAYDEREQRRLHVRPGLTCIWQVSGRSEVDFRTWVDMDLEYIDRWSLGLDISLLLRTVPAVVSCRGAY